MNLHDVRSCSWPSKSAGNVRNTLIKKCVFLSIGSFDHESLCKFFALVTTCAELCRLDVFTISLVVDKNQQFSEKPSSIHVLIMSLNHLVHRKFFCVFFFSFCSPHDLFLHQIAVPPYEAQNVLPCKEGHIWPKQELGTVTMLTALAHCLWNFTYWAEWIHWPCSVKQKGSKLVVTLMETTTLAFLGQCSIFVWCFLT